MFLCLCALDVDGCRSFFADRHLKCHRVALLQVIEFNALELIGMEEDILLLTFNSDEAKSSVCKTSNGSFLHCDENYAY